MLQLILVLDLIVFIYLFIFTGKSLKFKGAQPCEEALLLV